jgi:hypothetical protein
MGARQFETGGQESVPQEIQQVRACSQACWITSSAGLEPALFSHSLKALIAIHLSRKGKNPNSSFSP